MIISGGVLTRGIEPAKVRSRPTKCDTHHMQGFQASYRLPASRKRASVALGAATLVYFMFCCRLSISCQPYRRYLVFSGDAEKRDLAADEPSRVGDDLKDLVNEDLLKKAGDEPASEAGIQSIKTRTQRRR